MKINSNVYFIPIYYLLNEIPKLSPIDLIMHLTIVNLQSVGVNIEAWAIETAPTPDGPWIKLSHIPGSPHLLIYVVGSLENKRSVALRFDDLSDALIRHFKRAGSPRAGVMRVSGRSAMLGIVYSIFRIR